LELTLYDEAKWIGRKEAKNGTAIPKNECIGVKAAINASLSINC
jgi:hypothetical protein